VLSLRNSFRGLSSRKPELLIARTRGGDQHRHVKLRAYCRVATPTSICSTARRSSGSVVAIASNVGSATSPVAVRTRGRWTATFRPPITTSLRTVPARLAGRSGSWGIPRAADGRAVLFEHGCEHLQRRTQGQFQQTRSSCRRAERPAADDAAAIQRGERVRLCETSSWRLLHCEALATGLVTARFTRAVRSRRSQISTATGWDIPSWQLAAGSW